MERNYIFWGYVGPLSFIDLSWASADDPIITEHQFWNKVNGVSLYCHNMQIFNDSKAGKKQSRPTMIDYLMYQNQTVKYEQHSDIARQCSEQNWWHCRYLHTGSAKDRLQLRIFCFLHLSDTLNNLKCCYGYWPWSPLQFITSPLCETPQYLGYLHREGWECISAFWYIFIHICFNCCQLKVIIPEVIFIFFLLPQNLPHIHRSGNF